MLFCRLSRYSLGLFRRYSSARIPLYSFSKLDSCITFERRISIHGPYRNRYTHYKDAYPGKISYVYKTFYFCVLCMFVVQIFGGFNYIERMLYESDEKEKKRKVACSMINAKCQSVVTSLKDEESHQNESVKKKHVGFRDRKFIAYENRIRAYSTPDKIFRYFATLKSVEEDSETIYMTPEDFLRSITPGIKQPDGLDLDSFKRYDPKSEKLNLGIPKESVFYKLCDHALITFSDFIFLLTVLSTPHRQFEIAFRMFDINGDGELDINEFEVVRSVIMGTTAVGRRHRDNSTSGCTLKPSSSNSAFKCYFFGPNGDQKLPITEPKNGKITEVQFANSLLAYAGFPENKRRKMIRRVKTKFPVDSEHSSGITYKDFSDFSHLLRSIADVDTALTFYHMADDGQLSYREFVGVMRHRLLRGLDKPMDTGFIRLLSALFHCAKEQINLGVNSTYTNV
ncbi:Calcium uptake protein 1 like, mitochondrial [Schistosoma japonicum]|nr:Calcium uptake protein 1 like, mitochondrial [Schistosoma japonicum]KAH8866922.1 Calcium uptake protein 1 like, mitochondrial [Schistosoma japonicum]KAH8866925.1 Calcium uptake protein 1 like, mitochondrial [Schistosoma japonicum]